ncbi:MAG: type II toxin-antitoxin system HipA family toxin [Acidimicrobiia bacterium]
MNADVYKGEALAATLTRGTSEVAFSYLPGYVGPPVASSLPVTAEPMVVGAGQLPPFLAGLLPEGRRLTGLRQALKVSADDELSLLLAVGADTVGDVRVVPAGSTPSTVSPIVDLDDHPADLGALFERSIGPDYDRLAIPGVQPKVSGRMMTFPAKGAVGPVIVKLDPPEYSDVVRNEAAMLEAASLTGYRVPPHCVISDRRGANGLVVVRFDRSGAEGDPVRHPVEDGCQVLGRYPADKYLLDTVDVIRGLAERCSAPPVAALQLVDRLLLSYLVGDGDLHARNLAIWRNPQGLWEPTPVYDVVCTALYGDDTLAAPLAGGTTVRQMGRRRFTTAAIAAGVPERAVSHLIDRRVPTLAALVAGTLDSPPFTRFPSQSKTKRMLGRRAAALMR